MMRTLVGLICVTMTLTLASEATARKKKRRAHKPKVNNSRLLQSTYVPSTAPTPVVEAEVPAPLVEHDHFVLASVVMQGDVRYSPASVGLALAYQLRLSETWLLAAGAGVGLRADRTSLEPSVGLEAVFLSVGPVRLHAQGGISAPMQLMAGTTAVAVAGRAELGVRWPALDWLSPTAGVLVVAGPLVTPANLRWQPYVALQVVAGARFGL
jgi:hypothetical protein